MKKYKFGFDVWGLVLFIAVMIPNLISFAVTAPNDVFKNESLTPTIDIIASVFQVLMVTALCMIVRTDKPKCKAAKPLIVITVISYLCYLLAWVVYYQGVVNPFVILALCLCPCFAFFTYALFRKNYITIIPLAVFSMCHLIFGIVNFII